MDGVHSVPTYFGPDAAAEFGVLSYPADRRVRAAVLLCPSMGKEQAETTRGLKLFAERLAAKGFAVLRFDYRCTGESTGDQTDPDAVAQWIGSVDTAAQYLRSMGAPALVAMGHRMGSLLLAQSDVAAGADALIWWDPVAKGRQYIRAKTVLYNIVSENSSDAAESGLVHMAGQSLHPEAAAGLGKLALTDDAGAAVRADRVLAVIRESDSDGRFAKGQAGRGATVLETGDQSAFLEPNHPAVLTFPVEEFDRIIEWIDTAMPRDRVDIKVSTRDSAVIARTDDGRAVVTRILTAGPSWVWDTAVEGCHDGAKKVFVAHSLGQYVRTGPSRLWFELAQQVAARGGRGVRYDRPTVGESGCASADDGFLPLYLREYVADGADVLEGLRLPADASVAHAGICVGSWMAAHGALITARGGVTSTAVLVNPLMWRLPPLRKYRAEVIGAGEAVAGTPVAPPVNAFRTRVRKALWWRIGHAAPRIGRAVPRRLLRAVGRVPMVQLPGAVLETFAAAGVRPELVFAPQDYTFFEDAFGGMEAVQKSSTDVGVHPVPAGDHTSYNVAVRDEVTRVCLSALGL